MTDTARDVLLACDMAVRLTLEAAARSIRNRRGRAARALYDGVPDDKLYLALTPAPTVAEWERFADTFTRWWGLPSVLADTPRQRAYMVACHEYVRAAILSQTPHDVDALHAFLAEADAVAPAR
ncbi:hypothetical protein ACK8HH_17160 [Gordonia sp. LUNF6]|uniref:hypothetical protein n=1 Tax=unclassified Gordonia (in: high G+C Gram-positive bacteria) TaxID=2657482 RepID=UPI000785AB67|nr:hypothetical protein [Gordonia sp. QH-12]KXT55665.1 hypothetical protein Y710_18095 [Gordonia sp. QH-12]